MSEIISTLAALAFVLLAAYVALFLLKRTQGPADARLDLRFLTALPVGQRERLVAVAWRDEILLLGVTPGGVSLIDRQRAAASTDADDKAAEPDSAMVVLDVAGPAWARTLARLARRKAKP